MKEKYRPKIWINHNETTPEPTLDVEEFGIEYYKKVDLPAGIETLDISSQLKIVKRIIVEHYRKNKFLTSPYGEILGYYYLKDPNNTLEFDNKGNLIKFLGRYDKGRIELKVNNESVIELFKRFLNR